MDANTCQSHCILVESKYCGAPVTISINKSQVQPNGTVSVSAAQLPDGFTVQVMVGSRTLLTLTASNPSQPINVTSANGFSSSGDNTVSIKVLDNAGSAVNSLSKTFTVTVSANNTSNIYACPSIGTSPVWTCSNTNSNTCADVPGCASGTCTQVQVSQCGQSTTAAAVTSCTGGPALQGSCSSGLICSAATGGTCSIAVGGQTSNSYATLVNPISKFDNLTALLVNIMKGFLGIIAVWAVAFIVIGGFRMVVSSGNEEAVLAAKKTITWAVLGLLVAVLSFAIVAIVQNLVGVNIPATTTPSSSIPVTPGSSIPVTPGT